MKTDNMIFVFGSNLAGIHGSGAAAFARNYRGARWGVGYGHTGQSFAIPTKGERTGSDGKKHVGATLPLEEINTFVQSFLNEARTHPKYQYQITCIGCGLAGFKHGDIAPIFDDAPYNCFFDTSWRPYLTRDQSHFWGTF